MTRLDRQGFLGADSDRDLDATTVAIIGLGGGGSHIAQQCAHLGIGGYQLFDPDSIEDSNLNRLVGGTVADVIAGRSKVEIARRAIQSVLPKSAVAARSDPWQLHVDLLATCDVVVSCLDSVRAKDELDAFCRRMLIPMIDIGMDVTKHMDSFLIAGQVVVSTSPGPCLRCLGIVTEAALREEANRYGDAGSRPQVVWPNGLLASTAVSLLVQMLAPWYPNAKATRYLEYDGNDGTIRESHRLAAVRDRPCLHHPVEETGQALFDVRVPVARPGIRTSRPPETAP